MSEEKILEEVASLIRQASHPAVSEEIFNRLLMLISVTRPIFVRRTAKPAPDCTLSVTVEDFRAQYAQEPDENAERATDSRKHRKGATKIMEEDDE